MKYVFGIAEAPDHQVISIHIGLRYICLCQSCDRLITTGMSGAVVPLLQTADIEALKLLMELGKRSLEMPAPGAPFDLGEWLQNSNSP